MKLGGGAPRRIVGYMLNGTAQASVLGQVVSASTSDDNTYVAAAAGGTRACGVVGQAGIAVGGMVPIIRHGRAQVLFETDAATTRGLWATLSVTAEGRASDSYVAGGNVYGQGIGMILESKDANVLVWCSLTFSKYMDVPVGNID